MNINLIRYQNMHLEALDLAALLGHKASYDAHYLVVSMKYGADFYTCDRRLAQSIEGKYGWVHYVAPSVD